MPALTKVSTVIYSYGSSWLIIRETDAPRSPWRALHRQGGTETSGKVFPSLTEATRAIDATMRKVYQP